MQVLTGLFVALFFTVCFGNHAHAAKAAPTNLKGDGQSAGIILQDSTKSASMKIVVNKKAKEADAVQVIAQKEGEPGDAGIILNSETKPGDPTAIADKS